MNFFLRKDHCDHNFIGGNSQSKISQNLTTQTPLETSKSEKKTKYFINPKKTNSFKNVKSDEKIDSSIKKPFEISVLPTNNNYYLPEKASARLRENHQKRKNKTLMALSSLIPNSHKPKEKLMLSNVFKGSFGSARNSESIKYKFLLSSNYEKFASNYFYKESEDLKSFINKMKIEGFS